MAQSIRLSVLGPIRLVTADGEELPSLLSQARRTALLVYLALTQRRGPQRRDSLLALFWPEHDEQRARNALNQALHFLRRTLGNDVVASRGDDQLLLNPDLVWVDALEFDALLDAGRAMEGLELYRGALLEGFHISDAAPELEHWVDGERERLGRRYARALEQMAEKREEAGDPSGATLWWRKLAAHDPLGSRAALGLIRSLAAAGEPASALQQARIYEALVREELQAAPDPQITTLVRQLKERGDAAVNSHATKTGSGHLTDGPVADVNGVGSPTDAAVVYPNTAVVRARSQSYMSRGKLAAAASVVLLVLGAASLGKLRSAHAAAVIHSLAVLPFDGFSSDARQDYLAESLTDAIVTELARVPQLTVRSRQSVVQYKGAKTPLPEIARALGVDGIIQGTVLRDGKKIRVDVQLIYGPTDRHLWAKHFSRDASDVVALEDELADAIAREIPIAGAPDSTGIARRLRHYDPFVQSNYLRGENLLVSRTPWAVREATNLFREGIATDSTFAPGYSGIAGAFGIAGNYGFLPKALADESLHVYVQRALATDSLVAEAHVLLAGSLADAGDFGGAEREYKTAIRLEPSNAFAHHLYAMLLASQRRGAEAIRESQRAHEIEPQSVSIENARGRIRSYFGAPRDVSKRRTLPQIDPMNPWGLATHADANLALHGKCDAAKKEIERVKEEVPSNVRVMLYEVSVHLRCHDTTTARVVLNEAEQNFGARVHGSYIAEGFRRMRQLDSMYAWLDRTDWTLEQRFNFRTNKALDSLSGDSRYQRVLRRMGF